MTSSKDEDKKGFLNKDYWLARLTELKDSVMTKEISMRVYQTRVRKLKARARLQGIEL